MVINDRGVSLKKGCYRCLYEEVARAAAAPKRVWSMNARRGASTEAQGGHDGQGGADPLTQQSALDLMPQWRQESAFRWRRNEP
jgi:hypothetical protein